MLQRRTVVQAAYNRIKGFSCNIGPDHVRQRHADRIVAAKQHIYRHVLHELHQELDDPHAGDELIYEAAIADVFEEILAEISAQHEALHDVSRVLMDSHLREDHARPTAEHWAEAVPA